MEIGLHIESEFFIAAHHRDRYDIAPNFFRRLDGQRVTGIIFEGVEQNSNDFAFQIQQRRTAFTALRRQIYSQMFRRKISAETFAVEASDHAKAWRLSQIERISNRNHGSGDFESVRATDR